MASRPNAIGLPMTELWSSSLPHSGEAIESDAPREPARGDNGRLEALDGLRGAAALVVVLYHFFEHYGVEYRNAVFDRTGLELFNGPASVVTFFVLSGFVLYVAVARDPRGDRILNAIARRWPRLAAPALIAGLILTFGALAHLYPSPQTAPQEIISAKSSILEGYNRHAQDVFGVAYEAMIGAFVAVNPRYNPVLWTMHFELIGSFLVFSVAAARRIKFQAAGLAGIIGICLGAVVFSAWLIPFTFGMALAYAWDRLRHRDIRISNGVLLPSLAFCFIVFEIAGPNMTAGIAAGYDKVTIKYVWIGVQSVASSLLLLVTLWNESVRRLLTNGVFRGLGFMSFSVYLTHLTVLFSFSSWLFIAGTPAPINLIFTIAVSYAVAWPLSRFDQWWLGFLRKHVRLTLSTGLSSPSRWLRERRHLGAPIR